MPHSESGASIPGNTRVNGGRVNHASQLKPVLIRETRLADYEGIAALQSRNGISPRSHDDWAALWICNPAGCAAQMPIGWVLETATGEIVGSVANFAYEYRFRGRTLRVAAGGDWVVDTAYRGYSIQLIACNMKQGNIDVILTTTASPSSEPIIKVFGLQKAPVGTWDKTAFWVTDYRGFAKVALGAAPVRLPKPLTYVAASALGSLLWLRGAGLRKQAAHAEVEACTHFDNRFNKFWEQLHYEKDNFFLAVRTRDTLAWHFRRLTPGKDCWILTSRRGAQLVAYAVFDRKDNPVRRMSRVRLIDFQALNGFEHLLRPFLDWMLGECHRLGIHVLENVGCWLDRPDLPRIRIPHRRTMPAWSFYFRANDRELAKALGDPRVWAPSGFDGDVCL